MKADGVPCTGGCGEWIEHQDYICPVCKEDVFCSRECFWKGIPECMDYRQRKNSMTMYTPRTVVDKLFAKVQRDLTILQRFLDMVGDRTRFMVVLWVQDEAQLSIILSNTENWKETILQSVEVRPVLKATEKLQMGVYCSKTRQLETREVL